MGTCIRVLDRPFARFPCMALGLVCGGSDSLVDDVGGDLLFHDLVEDGRRRQVLVVCWLVAYDVNRPTSVGYLVEQQQGVSCEDAQPQSQRKMKSVRTWKSAPRMVAHRRFSSQP